MRALDAWSDRFQLVYYDQRGSGDTPLGDVGKVTFAGAIEDLDGLRTAPAGSASIGPPAPAP